MKDRMLVIGYDRALLQGMERRLRSGGLYPYFAEDLREVVGELDSAVKYSLVVIMGGTDVLRVIKEIRRMSTYSIRQGMRRGLRVCMP